MQKLAQIGKPITSKNSKLPTETTKKMCINSDSTLIKKTDNNVELVRHDGIFN